MSSGPQVFGADHAAPGAAAAATRVLVVDDHRVFTDVMRMSLERHEDITEVMVAHSAHEAAARASPSCFDAAIVDLDLPDASGLVLVARLRGLCPGTRVIVLTAHARPDLAERALAAGAVAFLSKAAKLDDVLAALRGGAVRAPLAAFEEDRHEPDLTHRERDVLRLLGQGRDPSRIAGDLGISVHTVRGHVKTIIAKMHAHSQLEAVVTAHRRGLITLGSRF